MAAGQAQAISDLYLKSGGDQANSRLSRFALKRLRDDLMEAVSLSPVDQETPWQHILDLLQFYYESWDEESASQAFLREVVGFLQYVSLATYLPVFVEITCIPSSAVVE